MSLIYSLIAKDPDIVLCGYSESTGNFQIYCQKILKKIHKNAMASYQYQDYIFHVYNKDSITYLAFSDKSYKEKVAYDFLETIHGLFTKKYSKRDIDVAISYSFKDFEDVLKEQMTFYNNKTNIKTIVETLKDAVIDEKNMILEASEVLSQRGEKLNLIVQKAEALTQESNSFARSAKRVKRNMQCKYIKYTLLVALCILVLVYVVISIICKGPLLPECINKEKK